MSAECCDLIIPIAYEPSKNQRKLLRACSCPNYPNDPLFGTKHQTFVGQDWMLFVVLVRTDLKDNQMETFQSSSEQTLLELQILCNLQEEMNVSAWMQSRDSMSRRALATSQISYSGTEKKLFR